MAGGAGPVFFKEVFEKGVKLVGIFALDEHRFGGTAVFECVEAGVGRGRQRDFGVELAGVLRRLLEVFFVAEVARIRGLFLFHLKLGSLVPSSGWKVGQWGQLKKTR